MIALYGPQSISNIMPLVVNVLESLDSSLADNKVHLGEGAFSIFINTFIRLGQLTYVHVCVGQGYWKRWGHAAVSFKLESFSFHYIIKIYVHILVHVSAYIHIHIYTCTYMYLQTFEHTCMHTYMYVLLMYLHTTCTHMCG